MNLRSSRTQLLLAFGTLFALPMSVAWLAALDAGPANEASAVATRQALATEVRVMANRRAIALRDLVLVKTAADRESARAMAVEADTALKASLAALDDAVAHGDDVATEERAMVADLDRIEARYGPVAASIRALAVAGDHDAAIDRMNAECRPLLAALLGVVRDYAAYGLAHAARRAESRTSDATRRASLVAWSTAVALVGLFVAGLVARRLVRSLGAEPAAVRAATDRLAAGDLRGVAGVADAAPRSVLAALGAMQTRLVARLGPVRRSADRIAMASAELARPDDDLFDRTAARASALAQAASSLRTLGAANRRSAAAGTADRLAGAACAAARRGCDDVGRVGATLGDLGDSNRRIVEIVGVMDGIVLETNILALNAAIAAAGAGEHGAGFAIVASGIRGLAGRSGAVARDVRDLIGASVERVARGTVLVDAAQVTMAEAVASIERVARITSGIGAAVAEQEAGVARVGAAVAAMDRVIGQDGASLERNRVVAERMRTDVRRLVEAVAAFTFDERGTDLAIAPVRVDQPVPGDATNRVRPSDIRSRRPVLVARGDDFRTRRCANDATMG